MVNRKKKEKKNRPRLKEQVILKPEFIKLTDSMNVLYFQYL